MPNTIRVPVEDPTLLRDADLYGPGALIRTQSSATETGTFADITGSDTTKPLVDGTRLYVINDPLGIDSTWYRNQFENAGATRTSGWSDPFQTGDETGGLICSVEDVEQELDVTLSDNDSESVLEKIRQVTAAMELYCGRWLTPHPTNPASTMTLLFDVPRMSRELRIESGHRVMGIRTLTSLGIATSSQPETGGVYTAATLSGVVLRPRPTADGPATKIVFTDISGAFFYPGYNTVSTTGSFGPASVDYDLQGVGIRAVARRHIGKASGNAVIAVGPNGTEFLLADMSGADRAALDMHRWIAVG